MGGPFFLLLGLHIRGKFLIIIQMGSIQKFTPSSPFRA
jgi:hypothetical protein